MKKTHDVDNLSDDSGPDIIGENPDNENYEYGEIEEVYLHPLNSVEFNEHSEDINY